MNDAQLRTPEGLRCGFTTGTCAAAAAAAAARLLLTGERPLQTALTTPSGIALTLPVEEGMLRDGCAVCAVRKDSGDDPDITNGVLVRAEVTRCESGITITGGEGIGRVTKPGLDQPVGASAINSVPRRMIGEALAAVASACGYAGGFSVILSIPGGEALARKTYNPVLGIEGGLSVIGTSGIVEPMSSRAVIDTIRTEARMHRAMGEASLLLTIGNYSEQFLRLSLPVPPERAVKCSNFIGEALDIGVSLGFSGILLIGHLGKLVKLGAGIMNTHSSYADGRMEVLITCGVIAGVPLPVLQALPDCVTVDAALAVLAQDGHLPAVLEVLSARIGQALTRRVRDAVPVAAIGFTGDTLLRTARADALLRAMTEA
ncbi:MAG: cobalamin biosynthesis protein CbiD [Oscillospiraceae bacterium]|nr:cobalamin biosynthesis protein CbiD [Oscillospiraceae bacterium]